MSKNYEYKSKIIAEIKEIFVNAFIDYIEKRLIDNKKILEGKFIDYTQAKVKLLKSGEERISALITYDINGEGKYKRERDYGLSNDWINRKLGNILEEQEHNKQDWVIFNEFKGQHYTKQEEVKVG